MWIGGGQQTSLDKCFEGAADVTGFGGSLLSDRAGDTASHFGGVSNLGFAGLAFGFPSAKGGIEDHLDDRINKYIGPNSPHPTLSLGQGRASLFRVGTVHTIPLAKLASLSPPTNNTLPTRCLLCRIEEERWPHTRLLSRACLPAGLAS